MITRRSLAGLLLGVSSGLTSAPVLARAPRPGEPNTFSTRELVESGHGFFGNVSRGLALTLEEATRRWGEPNGYILGQEASGAFFGGLRYGEGSLFMRRGPGQPDLLAGPVGRLRFRRRGRAPDDAGLQSQHSAPEMYKRFLELDGSAYFIAGFGMSAARADDTVVVPIRSGVGVRLGVALGYLKFSPTPTWNPF